MKKLFMGFCAVAFVLAVTGCAEPAPKSSAGNNSAEWQQFKGKKGQDELSAEVEKQKAEKQ